MCSLKVFPVSCQQLRATAKFQLAVAGTLLNFPLPPICSSLLLSWKSSLAKGWSTHAVSLPPFASLHRTLFSFLLPHLTAQVIACYCCSVAKLCPTHCKPMYYSQLVSSVHGISQARILEWVAISLSKESSWIRDRTHVFCPAVRFFTTEPLGKLRSLMPN